MSKPYVSVEPPPGPTLPAAEPWMVMATPEMFDSVSPASFLPMAGIPSTDMRELGHLAKVTDGRFGAMVLRSNPDIPYDMSVAGPWHVHNTAFHWGYVLQGWMVFEAEGVGAVRLDVGASMYQPENNRHRVVATSPDFIALEISSPAALNTTFYIHDDETGEWRDVFFDTNDDDVPLEQVGMAHATRWVTEMMEAMAPSP